jgi:hypothetical protein
MSHLGALFYSFSRNFMKLSYLIWFELVLGAEPLCDDFNCCWLELAIRGKA